MDRNNKESSQGMAVRDGEPLGLITLIAVVSGVFAAVLLLMLIRAMIRRTRNAKEDEVKGVEGLPKFRALDQNSNSVPTPQPPSHYSNPAFSLEDESDPKRDSVHRSPERDKITKLCAKNASPKE